MEVEIVRYIYRLYPDPEQRRLFAKIFGCTRVVWNDAVALAQVSRKGKTKHPGYVELTKQLITRAKKTPERAWLKEVSVVPLQQTLRAYNRARSEAFRALKGKRPAVGFPRFKSKQGKQSAEFTLSGFSLRGRVLYLAKIGKVKVRWSRDLPSAPTSATVTLKPDGRYYVSFVVRRKPKRLPVVDSTVGIDLGLTDFAVLSTGEKIVNPKHYARGERKLGRLQRALSRKTKGSRRRERARIAVARQHAKVANQRKDFLHKLSSKVIGENQTVTIEDLCVKGMGRGMLSKSVMHAGWGIFRLMLEYKAASAGRELVVVDRFFPSTKKCSACGVVSDSKPLSIRRWSCGACGAEHDRDINAARNLDAVGQAESQNGRGGMVRPSAIASLARLLKRQPIDCEAQHVLRP